jgi:hypothetical protein
MAAECVLHLYQNNPSPAKHASKKVQRDVAFKTISARFLAFALLVF